jgi:hypothetical protein
VRRDCHLDEVRAAQAAEVAANSELQAANYANDANLLGAAQAFSNSKQQKRFELFDARLARLTVPRFL